jgi:HSP20 family protein
MEATVNLTKWDPFRELEDMTQRLNRIFGRSLVSTEKGTEAMKVAEWAPAVDVCETQNEYTIKAELPEVKKEDVKVTMQDGVLTIQGERKQEKEEKGKRYHRIERSYGSFLRSFDLPENVDESKAKADFKDGVLTLSLPKTEKAKPKAIEVTVA